MKMVIALVMHDSCMASTMSMGIVYALIYSALLVDYEADIISSLLCHQG